MEHNAFIYNDKTYICTPNSALVFLYLEKVVVVSHIPQSDVEDNHCFVFNSGCEENIEDTSRTGAGLERDGSPQPEPCLQSLINRLDASISTKHSLLH